MIEYISGKVAELTPTQVVIDCNGVGYLLFVSLNTYTSIQGKKDAKLYVYEVIREDAYSLFGFSSKDERNLFLLLIGISGIGGQTARMILSAYSPAELCDIISSGNDRLLKSIKGIGPKAAQRIIVELKDKVVTAMGNLSSASSALPASSINKEVVEEAISALTMLGFPPAAVQKTVMAIVKENPSLAVEQIIKSGLKML